MPYVKQEARERLFDRQGAETCGELNYLFTTLALEYLKTKGESYQTYNDIIVALECAKLEMYRRKVVAYEDTKIRENGDVY
jgi:hypothetical protein